MFGREERRKEEDIADGEDSPMSSPLDESYKIRIPRGSLSPRSHEDEEHMKNEDSEVQDLSVNNQHYCKMEDESAEEERSEEAEEDNWVPVDNSIYSIMTIPPPCS